MINTKTLNAQKLAEYKAAIQSGMITSKNSLIDPVLVEKVLSRMDGHVFLEAAVEANEDGELGRGYDLLMGSCQAFYTENREIALDLIKSVVMGVRHPTYKDETLLTAVESMYSKHIYQETTAEHVQRILDGYIPSSDNDDPVGLIEAYEAVSYQVVAHCIMETCFAFAEYSKEEVA